MQSTGERRAHGVPWIDRRGNRGGCGGQGAAVRHSVDREKGPGIDERRHLGAQQIERKLVDAVEGGGELHLGQRCELRQPGVEFGRVRHVAELPEVLRVDDPEASSADEHVAFDWDAAEFASAERNPHRSTALREAPHRASDGGSPDDRRAGVE